MRRTLILPILLAVLAGCATKVENVQTTAGFRPALLSEGPVLLGAFVAADRLGNEYPEGKGTPPRYDVLAQTDTWAPLLYTGFLQEAPGLTVWPWPTLQSATDDTLLMPMMQAVARGGLLREDDLQAVRDALPGARFLAVARLDGNEVSLQEMGLVTQTQRDHEGRALHANDREQAITTRRRVVMTLEIYDLETGLSPWAATVRQDGKELYNPVEAVPTPPDTSGTANPNIRVKGTPRQGPPLENVLRGACKAAVDRLMGTAKSTPDD